MPESALRIDVALLPCQLAGEPWAGRTAVVFDVLRFSSSLVRAFESGAAGAVPVAEPEAALGLVSSLVADLAGGERGGTKLPGFDLGNSPLEYTPGRVRGKTLALTTTNGTRALLACSGARAVWVGCFRNLPELALRLAASADPIAAVCAGTNGRFALEDALAAGALVERLGRSRSLDLTDAARAAQSLWQEARPDLGAALRATDHGQRLLALGFEADLALCAQESPSAPVPRWDWEQNRIRLP